MERTYKCPVCGRVFTDLLSLKRCMAADEEKMEREAKAEAARKKAQEAEKAVQRQRYTDSIKTQRAEIEEKLSALKVKIAAYNRLVAMAAQNAGVTAAPCSISVTFASVTDLDKAVEDLSEKISSYFNDTRHCARSTKIEDTDDLATIISKIIGI